MDNDNVYAPVALDVYRNLLERFPANPHTVIHDVLSDFLARTAEDYPSERRGEGIVWERLKLPNGSKIRTRYFGEYYEAEVVGRKILWKGLQFASVSKLINKMRGGTNNNAWNHAEVKRPDDFDWIPAMKLRI